MKLSSEPDKIHSLIEYRCMHGKGRNIFFLQIAFACAKISTDLFFPAAHPNKRIKTAG